MHSHYATCSFVPYVPVLQEHNSLAGSHGDYDPEIFAVRLHDELVDVEDEMQTYTEYKADAGDIGAKNLMGIRRCALA